jgi:hypothetical protein
LPNCWSCSKMVWWWEEDTIPISSRRRPNMIWYLWSHLIPSANFIRIQTTNLVL